MARAGQRSACPQCGAPLFFGGAHSIVSVCGHCRSAIARVGVDVQSLGRMPDLVTTDTRLSIGCSGKLARLSFTIVGRVQLHQGAAGWDEWYVTWSDGSYGWVAEARGRLIVTHRFDQAVRVPPFDGLRAGTAIEVPGIGLLSIEETGESQILSAQGELPFQPQFGRKYRFADGSLKNSGFVTLDYGFVGDDAEVFLGREMSYAEAGITQLGPEPQFRAPAMRGEALSCPSCGAPLSFKSSEGISIVCDSCRSLCSLSEGKLALIAVFKSRVPPRLPLGARGKLFGHQLEVIGWVRRACPGEDGEYTWDEYLLHGDAGYRWLSESNGHWTYLKPVPAAEVDETVPNVSALFDGQQYRRFTTSHGVRYVDMQGEFYWHLTMNDRLEMVDYVRPPEMLSCEKSKQEAQWTHGRYVDPHELWTSFKQSGAPPMRSGVGPCQPNPHRANVTSMWLASGLAVLLMILLTFLIMMELPRRVALVFEVPLGAEQNVALSPAFQISGSTHAAEISAAALGAMAGTSSWVGLDIALINDETGASDTLALELSHYEGYEDGSRWVEDTSVSKEIVGSVPAGRYVLRVEPHIEPGSRVADAVQIRVTHGVWQGLPIVAATILLLFPALLLTFRSGGFESRRWSESDHSGSSGSDDDDD